MATTSNYVPLRTVNVTDTQKVSVKQERITSYQPRIVKPEPGIYLRHRANPQDRERPWKFVHVSGRICNQGGERDCNSQSENEDNCEEPDSATLPDLPNVPDPSLPTRNLTTNNFPTETPIIPPPATKSITVDLISPPAIERRDFVPSTSATATNVMTKSLGDFLCTLNFNVQPETSSSTTADGTRNVKTNSSNMALDNYNTGLLLPGEQIPLPSNSNTHKVVTPAHAAKDIPSVNTETMSPLEPRQVVTIFSDDSSPSHADSNQQNIRQVATTLPAKEHTSLTPTPGLITPLRHHQQDKAVRETGFSPDLSTPSQPVTPTGKSPSDTFLPTQEDDSNQTKASTNLDSTPRSVVTDPDATELETANVLLQLGTVNDSTIAQHDQLETNYDSSILLPVDAAPLEDFAKEMSKNDVPTESDQNKIVENANDESIDSTDSNKTVDYTTLTEEKLPKGNLKYKQYGIPRQSPKTGPNRNHRCPYCEVICHSKHEWNMHHKSEHTTVKCPDCYKLFPTPDALNRHRYVYNESHRFKCTQCDKVCTFKSDLDQHMSVHTDEKLWICSHDGCTRDFKHKSDLTAHEVVHTGEDFMCEFSKL